MFSSKSTISVSTNGVGQLTRSAKSLSSARSLSPALSRSSKLSISSVKIPHVQYLSPLKLWWLSFLVVWTVVVVKCDARDVIQQTNLDAEVVDKYLSTFGYYPEKQGSVQADGDSSSRTLTDVAAGGHTEDERHRAIERLQTFFHLPLSGQLDVNTNSIIKTARCGRKDVTVNEIEDDKHQDGGRRVKRYSVNKYPDGGLANWNASQLSWKLSSPSGQISESQQKEVIRQSLAMWAEYMPVKFVEDRSQDVPDIDIQFVRGQHGPRQDPIFDGSPTGIVNVLAHAWGPGFNAKGLAGDVHFDEDDDWKDSKQLLGVAVHELGHSMGLGHSDDPSAIMYPVYRDVVELGQDDIDGIRLMYGSGAGIRPGNPDANRPRTRAPPFQTQRPDARYLTELPPIRYNTPNPRYRTNGPDYRYRTDRQDPWYRTQRPDVTLYPRYRTDRTGPQYRTVRPDTRSWTRHPDPRIVPLNPWTRAPYYTVKPEWVNPPTTELSEGLCAQVEVDAVFEDPTTKLGRIFIAVSNENVHTLTQHGHLIKSERVKDVYPGVPINPDVAFSISEKRTVYFIKDFIMWAYKEGQLEKGFPRSLRSFQFPEHPKFSITVPQKDGGSRLLLFGARYWWMFDVDRSSPVAYQPISDFSGQLPSGVRFATQWLDNYLYAVTDDSYVIMDLDRRRITHEKPISGKPDWLHGLCGHASRFMVPHLSSKHIPTLYEATIYIGQALTIQQYGNLGCFNNSVTDLQNSSVMRMRKEMWTIQVNSKKPQLHSEDTYAHLLELELR